MKLTNEQIKELKLLEEDAKPAPWKTMDKAGIVCGEDYRAIAINFATRADNIFVSKLRNASAALLEEVLASREVIKFYGDYQNMYDTVKDDDGRSLAYINGIDQYVTGNDLEKISGNLHYGKRARAHLAKYASEEDK